VRSSSFGVSLSRSKHRRLRPASLMLALLVLAGVRTGGSRTGRWQNSRLVSNLERSA
jgi:hypothetical protein